MYEHIVFLRLPTAFRVEIGVVCSIVYRVVRLFPRVHAPYLVNDRGVDAARREGGFPALGSDPRSGKLKPLAFSRE